MYPHCLSRALVFATFVTLSFTAPTRSSSDSGSITPGCREQDKRSACLSTLETANSQTPARNDSSQDPAKDSDVKSLHDLFPHWAEIEPSHDVVYHDCLKKFKCARLLVPLNWRNKSDPRTAAIAIMTLPAKVPANDSRFAGSVFINPGGPGESGVDFARDDAQSIQKMIDIPGSRYYEIVGFDPRGTGSTTPASNCFPDARQREMWIVELRGAGGYSGIGHGSPSEGPMAYALAMNKAFNQQCLANEAKFAHGMSFASTANVARDMVEMIDKIDLLRKKEYPDGYVGEKTTPRLQYMGFSYGTLLGATFMSMFPGRVGRMVLDGVIDADDYVTGPGGLQSTVEADEIFDEFWEGCFKAGPDVCPWANSTEFSNAKRAQKDFWSWVDNLDTSPRIIQGPVNNSIIVTGNDVRKTIGLVSYSPKQHFPIFARSLHAAMSGDAAGLKDVGTGSTYTPTSDDICRTRAKLESANYTEHSYLEMPSSRAESQYAVSCSDGEVIADKSISWWLDYARTQEKASKIFGRVWALDRLKCSHWPFKPNWKFSGPFTSPEHDERVMPGVPAAPILFLSSRLDPITPLRAARKMAQQYPGSEVVVQDSIGHTALGSAYSTCTISLVASYFESGTVTGKEVSCSVDCEIWDRSCHLSRFSDTEEEGGTEPARLWFGHHPWLLRMPRHRLHQS